MAESHSQNFNHLKENNLKSLLDQCELIYDTPEWEFPKGRRSSHESNMKCAIREFEEETGYTKNDIMVINNILPLEEIFTGSNYKSYKHKYFLGYMNNDIIPKDIFQVYEISKIEWVSIDNAVKYIRDYNYEKKDILIQLNNLLKTYKLYI